VLLRTSALCTVRLVPAAAALLLCVIVGITDDDTLTARCQAQTIKVRLAEIDAPEKGQPFADRSKQHLSSLCYASPAFAMSMSGGGPVWPTGAVWPSVRRS
jgi:endonuclease YncB( thermonuclease family)